MKKLFNNRWFVVALAVCSLLLLVRSIAEPLLGKPDFSNVEPVEDFLDEVLATEPEQRSIIRQANNEPRRSGDSVLNAELTWIRTPQRDPFSDGLIEQRSQSPANGRTTAPPVQGALPRLTGLVAGPETLYAVLGDQIVLEGDEVGDFRVIQISSDGVRIRNDRESVWLPRPGKR